MNFFFENSNGLDQGLMGIRIVIRLPEMRLTEPLKDIALQFKEHCGDAENAFDFGLVSPVEPPLGLYCTCHGHMEEGKVSHFRLALQRKPERPAPKGLYEASERLGGFELGMPRLFSAFEAQDGLARVEFEAIVFDRKNWPLRFKKRRPPSNLGNFSFEKEELYFTDSEKKTTATIGLERGDAAYMVTIRSKISVKLESGCFEVAAATLWNEIQTLINNR